MRNLSPRLDNVWVRTPQVGNPEVSYGTVPTYLEDLVQIFSCFKGTFLVWTNLILMDFGNPEGKNTVLSRW